MNITRRQFFDAVAETIKAEWPAVRYITANAEELPTAGSVAGCKDWAALADRLGIPKECKHEPKKWVTYTGIKTLEPECVHCGIQLAATWTEK